jgi:hypothetical protein
LTCEGLTETRAKKFVGQGAKASGNTSHGAFHTTTKLVKRPLRIVKFSIWFDLPCLRRNAARPAGEKVVWPRGIARKRRNIPNLCPFPCPVSLFAVECITWGGRKPPVLSVFRVEKKSVHLLVSTSFFFSFAPRFIRLNQRRFKQRSCWGRGAHGRPWSGPGCSRGPCRA